jgi:hypothetical protein
VQIENLCGSCITDGDGDDLVTKDSANCYISYVYKCGDIWSFATYFGELGGLGPGEPDEDISSAAFEVELT